MTLESFPQWAATFDWCSMAALRLQLYSAGASLGSASAFMMMIGDDSYLVTNRHVVSGVRPDTGESFDPSGNHPEFMLVALWRNCEGGPSWMPLVQRLRDKNGARLWVDHPRGQTYDVVAVPLANPYGTLGRTVPPPGDYEKLIWVPPASQLSVIGFPRGYSGPGITPLWVNGSLASEINYESEPYFHVDANTAPGMSGSLVVARRYGSVEVDPRAQRLEPGVIKEGDRLSFNASVITRPMGIYAGRMDPQLSIGRVWRWRVVDELIGHISAMPKRPTPDGTLACLPRQAPSTPPFVVLDNSPLPAVGGQRPSAILMSTVPQWSAIAVSFDDVETMALFKTACHEGAESDKILLTAREHALLRRAVLDPNFRKDYSGFSTAFERVLAAIDCT